MKKILYISYDGMTDPLGQSQVIPYLVGLSKKGFKIHILSCEKKKNYSENKVHISELLKKNNIDWHPVIYTKSPPVLSTLWDIWRMRRKAIRLHKKENFSIVHCRSYIPSIIGLHLKKAYQVKFIFDMRGFWADERLDGNIWNIKNPFYNFIYKYFKKKENLFLSNADYTISLTEKAKNIIQQWNTIPNQPIPIQVIPCCTDTDHFSRAKINPKTVNLLRNEIGISHDDFIISYLGSLGTWYLLDEMLLFFKLLLKSKPRSKFFFITHEDSQKIVNAALKQNIPIEKIIVKHANREELPSFLSLSNLSIFFIKPTFSKYASSPTKLGELLSMGVPIICNGNIGDIDVLLKKTNCGLVVENFSEKSILNVINNIDSLLLKDKSKLREVAISYFSIELGLIYYRQVYNKLCSS